MELLSEKLKGFRVTLGSSSPRRKELLAALNIDFQVEKSEAEAELIPNGVELLSIPEHLSLQKSLNFQRALLPNEILITADTLVFLDKRILGKPLDREDAKKMLEALSGRSHTVVTGVTVRTLYKRESFSGISEVFFREISPQEIEYYLDHFKPYDKAGAYGIQEWIGYSAIENINGSYHNVMGLPTALLSKKLSQFIE